MEEGVQSRVGDGGAWPREGGERGWAAVSRLLKSTSEPLGFNPSSVRPVLVSTAV